MTTEHTPLPWTHDEWTPLRSGRLHIRDANNELVAVIIEPDSPALAEFIVRACNSHDELLEALKEYGHHEERCRALNFISDPCNCGLDEVVSKARGESDE